MTFKERMKSDISVVRGPDFVDQVEKFVHSELFPLEQINVASSDVPQRRNEKTAGIATATIGVSETCKETQID